MYRPGFCNIHTFLACLLVALCSTRSALAAADTYDFPTRSAVAELVCIEQVIDREGKAKSRRYNVRAQGPVHLPGDTLVEVDLKFDGPQEMQYLDQLSRAHVITFQARNLDLEDSQLMHIKDYKQLWVLNLDTTLVSDKSLPLIGTFKTLSDLRLSGTNIKGTGFEHLNKLTQLTRLNLGALTLTMGAIAKLKPLMTHLLDFNLSRTDLTREDCANLVNLTAAQYLDIAFNRKIDDSCAGYFTHLTKLQTLTINDTGITDKSLPILLKLPNLKQVVIRGKEFWKSGMPKNKVGHIKFVDVSAKNEVPSEVFGPLH